MSAQADRLAQAVSALKAGKIILLNGDRLRGGDIDLMVAAEFADAAAVSFMANHGRGLICLTMTNERAMRLGITLINPGRERQTGRPFGRSIEAGSGVTTGISAADRAHTVAVAISDNASADDIVSPGHVFPLISQEGGVAQRTSAVEASIALCRLAGLQDAAVICSVMRDDGEMARIDDMADFIATHDMAVAEIGDLL